MRFHFLLFCIKLLILNFFYKEFFKNLFHFIKFSVIIIKLFPLLLLERKLLKEEIPVYTLTLLKLKYFNFKRSRHLLSI